MIKTLVGPLACAVALCLVASSVAVAQSTVYSTGFEAAGGFIPGNLNGQDSWAVTGGASNVTVGLGAQSSAQFVQLGAASVISRSASNAANRAIVRSYYQGNGSATLVAPTGPSPIAAAIAFRTVDASNIAVAGWDGSTNAWVEPAGPVTFSNAAWHEIVVTMDYTAHTFNVRVDGQNHLQNVPFDDVTVNQLHGISASSTTSSRVDGIGLFASAANGDYDGDGWTDKFESSGGNSNPLVGTSSTDYVTGDEPSFGDFNADNFHDAADYQALAAQLTNGTASVATGDMNGNGTVDVRDVTVYGNRVAGIITLMR